MKRRDFLRSVEGFGGAALLGSFSASMSSQPMNAQNTGSSHARSDSDTATKPFAVPAGISRLPEIVLQGKRVLVKVSGSDNNGAFAMFEVPTVMDAGAPLHIHHVENELFYVLEGEYDIRVGDQMFHLTPGASAYGPRLIPHTWHDVGNVPGKLLVVAQPAGHLEAFTVELAKLTASGSPNPAAMKELFVRHDMEIVGPPLPKKNST